MKTRELRYEEKAALLMALANERTRAQDKVLELWDRAEAAEKAGPEGFCVTLNDDADRYEELADRVDTLMEFLIDGVIVIKISDSEE